MRTMWVGFIFLVALILLGGSTLFIGSLWDVLGHPPTILVIGVTDASGIKAGDDVRIDGIDAGKVDNVTLDPRGVGIVLKLYRAPELHKGFSISIEGRAVWGGAFVDIRRGNLNEPVIELDKLEKVAGYPFVIGQTKYDLFKAGSIMIEQNAASVKELIENIRDLSRQVKDANITERVNETIDAAKNSITEIKHAAERTTNVLDKINELADDAKAGKGTAGKLLKDEQLYNEMVKTVKDLQTVVKDFREGEGVVPALVHDKQMKSKVDSILEQIDVTSKNVKEISEGVRKSWLLEGIQDEKNYEKIKATLEGADKTLGKVGRAKTYLNVSYTSFPASRETVERVGIAYAPSDDKYLFAGLAVLDVAPGSRKILTDSQSTNDDEIKYAIEAQLAYTIPWFLDKHLTLRAGLIEGRVGAALDFEWDDWKLFHYPVRLTVEGRQSYSSLKRDNIDEELNGWMWRAYAETPIFPEGKGWFGNILSRIKVIGGSSRVFADSEFFVGVALKFEDEDIKSFVGLATSAR